MSKRIIIDANFASETRIVLADKSNNIESLDLSSLNKRQIKGNIYLGRVTQVVASLEAAFVEYSNGKSGFLPFREIHPGYYQNSVSARNNADGAHALQELKAAKITSEDLADSEHEGCATIVDVDEEVDITQLEKMVDDKVPSDFDIEAADDDIEPISSKSSSELESSKNFKINDVIKKGQILLVQMTKEERGNKGASMTTYISLAGKYCVLMPNKSSNNGISRKISSAEERKRLKRIINDLTSGNDHKNFSVIVRTAGIGHSTIEIKKDYDYLVRLWNKIRETTLASVAPCFIHQEDGLILKTIRDTFDKNVKEIVVQGRDAYESCLRFMTDISPSDVKYIKEYKGKTPIFTKFGIEDQLIKLYQPVVPLPSGGYIVINPTEALISIDVNSGKSTSERNIEDTALKTNLEAAKEIARQAKLRDLSGLIVVDFIDLIDSKHRKILERSLWEYFSKDKARIQTSNISNFGLLEMSRQRLRPSFLEMHSNMCHHCNGKGLVRADGSNAMLILRTIENEIFNDVYDIVNVYAVSKAILYLLNYKREEIAFIESKYNIRLNFIVDIDATADSYSIEKIKLADKNKVLPNDEIPALNDKASIYRDIQDEENTNSVFGRQKIERTTKTKTARKKAVGAKKKLADDVSVEANIEAAETPSLNVKTENIEKLNSSAKDKMNEMEKSDVPASNVEMPDASTVAELNKGDVEVETEVQADVATPKASPRKRRTNLKSDRARQAKRRFKKKKTDMSAPAAENIDSAPVEQELQR